MQKSVPHIIRSVSGQHKALGLPGPSHPLVAVFEFSQIDYRYADTSRDTLILDLYCISLKRNVREKLRYGQGYCDFDEGVLFCTAPGQLTGNITDDHRPSGWCVVFHPDFIRRFPLVQRIKDYGFFDYAVKEALHLSQQEEERVIAVMKMLRDELNGRTDNYSEDVIVAHLELLLSHTQRFYGRQFLTRKPEHSDLPVRINTLLADYFAGAQTSTEGLPSVAYLAGKMNLSDSYLSDLLKSLTGLNAQQHIQQYIVDEAKTLLAQTNLTVGEIGYKLGFGFPQSFSRLFKSKTKLTPVQYRKSFS